MLEEFKHVSQPKGPGRRRWFADDEIDLILWYDESETLTGFQLCYDISGNERAFTWKKGARLQHTAIDSGEQSPLFNRSPMLVADGAPPIEKVVSDFRARSGSLASDLVEMIAATISGFKTGPNSAT